MTNRIDKVNSLLEREIGKLLQNKTGFSNDVLVTLTHVEATPNLIEARVYISVFPDDKIDEVVRNLNKNVYDIQQRINRKLNMRPVPRIMFVKDMNISKALKVEELLEKLKKEEK